MGTVIRSKISYKSPYYLSQNRYLELKHFCLQYSDFCKQIAKESEKIGLKSHLPSVQTTTGEIDQTGRKAANIAFYGHYVDMIDDCCTKAGGDIAKWLFECVTKGKSYAVLCPPCSKGYFYLRYRAFFWLLDKCR